MSTDISWLLEHFDGEEWVPAVHVADLLADPRTHLGIVNVCWWSVRNDRTSLFFGNTAIFPFHQGLPVDLARSTREFVEPNFETDQTFAGWICLRDLELPSWKTQQIFVGGSVKIRYAELFGDGMQPPPVEALREQGITDPVLENVTNWKSKRQLTPSPVLPHKIHGLSPDFLVPVTWRETLADFVGHIWCDGLANLAGIDLPERYRIVTAIG